MTKGGGRHNVEGGGGSKQEDLGLPRLIARIWGLVSGISFVSNGGYLLVKIHDEPKCQGAGGYMIFFGLIFIILECACCMCSAKNNLCDQFEEKVPFWAKSLFYVIVTIPPLGLCFGVKTVISALIVIMEGIIYLFLYCLVRSNKYERLREASKVEMKRRTNQAQGYGTILSTANNAMNFFKDTANANATKQPNNRQQTSKSHAGGGRSKGKPRSVTSVA